MRALYRGFSLHQYQSNQTTKLTDVELVKMNLLTHIYTRRGERLMMSDFGTDIPDLIFEQLTPDVVSLIEQDLINVCNYDPRIELIECQVTPLWDEGAVIANLKVKYIELNLEETIPLRIDFESEQ